MTEWNIAMTGAVRSGTIVYREDEHRATFYWELGAGDVVFLISGPAPQRWDVELPWAIGRRRQILERVAEEVIRRESPTCRAEYGDEDTTITIRQPSR